MKTNTITRALVALIIILAFTLTGLAESPYPSGSIANALVVANGQLQHASTRTAGVTALQTQLTAIEALDNNTTVPVFELVGIVTYLGSCRDVVDANGTSATTKRVDAAIIQVKSIIAAKRAAAAYLPSNHGILAFLALGMVSIRPKRRLTGLNSLCFLGFPRPAYGSTDNDSAPAPDSKPFVPTGMPLHGNPNPGEGSANATDDKRDETELADNALKAAAPVTAADSSGNTELLDLLSRAETVRDGSELPREDIVALRIHLQRFRGQGDALAARVDEETNRLEALLLGLNVKAGDAKANRKSPTGQKKK